MGSLIYGDPGKETLIATHIRLWLPLGTREIVPDIGKYLPEVRRVIEKYGYGAGDSLMEAKAHARRLAGPGLDRSVSSGILSALESAQPQCGEGLPSRGGF